MEKIYPALYATAPTVKTTQVANALHFVMFDQAQAFNEIPGSPSWRASHGAKAVLWINVDPSCFGASAQ